MNLETICISGAIIAIPRLRPTNYNGSCSEQRAKNIHYLRCCEIYLLSLKNRWRMATRIQGEPEVCFLHFSTKWRREKLRKHRYSCQNSTQSKIYRPWNLLEIETKDSLNIWHLFWMAIIHIKFIFSSCSLRLKLLFI